MKSNKTAIERLTKALALLLIAALLISLVPLYGAAAYSKPGVDDYRYGRTTHIVWEDTHNWMAVLAEAGRVASNTYQQWQGSYAAIFLMALQPGIFQTNVYGLTTAFLLTGLVIALLWFVYTVLTNLMETDWTQSMSIATLVAISCVQLLPSPVEGYFWFNGGVYYTFFFSLSLIAATLLIRREQKKTVAQCVLLPLLMTLLAGGNLVTGLLCCVALSLYVVQSSIRRRHDVLTLVLWILLVGLFMANALAPGNSVRQAEHASESLSPLSAILAAMVDTMKYVGQWLTEPVTFLAFASLPLLWQMTGRATFQFRMPLVMLVASFLLLAAGFTPTEYALGFAGEARLIDIQFYLFVLLLYGNLIWMVGWLRQHFGTERVYVRRTVAIALTVVCLSITGITALRSRNIASVSAVRILYNGSARSYAETWEKRYAMLNDAEPVVILPRLSHQPPLLCMMDIVPNESDENYWYNQQLETYYGKKQVLREPDIEE
ncbi:MAG: hypothetical protein RRZ24_07345 [Clostridia bacterium]